MPANLPIEIWQIVLRKVGHIDGALETKMTTHFEWLDWQYDEKNKYAKSMANKWSLVRVCKAWYRFSLELLYEDIRLHSIDQAENLHATLCASNPERSGNERGKGWWTKRLDISYLKIAKPFLYSLATHFPNLYILRFPLADYIPYGSVELPPKLRYTFMLADYQEDTTPQHLDTLLLVLSYKHTYTFSNLTALEIYIDYDDPTLLLSYSFPNVRHLTIHEITEWDISVLRSFLQQYGPQLVSLRVVDWDAELLTLTPNIKELIIHPRRVIPHFNDQQTCPSVTHIGILLHSFRWHDALTDPFLDPSRFPNVKCVRLNSPVFSPVDDPIRLKKCKDLYKKNGLVQRGVRFEDAEGNTWSDFMNASQ